MMTIAFNLFGTWVVFSTFGKTIDREIEQMSSENRMFKIIFEMTINSLKENNITDKRLAEIAETMNKSISVNKYYICLYNSDAVMIYENTPTQNVHMALNEFAENKRIYKISSDGDKKLLIFACSIDIDGSEYHIETTKDISYVYNDRAEMLSQIQVITLLAVVLTAFITLIVSHFLTRPISYLSRTARKLARGNFYVRSNYTGADEIGMLSRDFNFMANKIEQKIDELRDRAEKQEDFTASFAHELKTPLTSIVGYSDMIRTTAMSPQETMEYANYIYTQGKRLESLSFKLLELISTGKTKAPFKKISMEALLSDVYDAVYPSLSQKNIRLEVSYTKAYVYGDRELLSSLLINLIDNARKASNEHSKILLIGALSGKFYKISVSDSGVGIPAKELARITEAFYMVDKSRSRKEGGAGLGLSLCSKIVQMHSGRWEIESREGKGTTVTVMLPLKGGKENES
ncbi:histidine protein kinase SaeS [Clostridiales bacterium]|nr:histidine protein kinase SaeS [Clostridiales bacterium]